MSQRNEHSQAGPAAGGRANRLIHETSPYLLQHARNPVDWFPWGAEAFEKARAESRPVFLSIGYSTCHWCHVMEKESFEDPEVAALLNGSFVPIKVDREERPDLDQIYMTTCQALTGHGGWPLTVFLTPERRPFFAGTYFPKRSMAGRVGLVDLLGQIRALWDERREEIGQSADKITDLVRKLSAGGPGAPLSARDLEAAYADLSRGYDARRGGFGSAPKFPTPHNLRFLLRWWARSGDANALRMVERTLEAMRKGGIFDHLGYGLHRYSTDAEWLVPHFEKMLYDQALLARACLEAYQATGREELAGVAREIFAYVLRDMTSPDGGFYSAEDADSEGVEGKFYVWREAEIREVLGPEEGRRFCEAFRVREAGNFRDEASGGVTGLNILHRDDLPAGDAALERSRRKLFEARGRRVRPLLDDKILTDWNGLMISALARGYQALGDPGLLEAAERAQAFVAGKLTDNKGRLLKSYRQGKTSGVGFLDDYAFVVQGLLDLYEAGFRVTYLEEALRLTRVMLDRFWDPGQGGLFQTADDAEALVVRAKDCYDGAIPSGNSVAALSLLRLSRMTGRADLAEKAWAVLGAFSEQIGRHPTAHTEALIALDFALGPTQEVVIAGRGPAADTAAMLAALRSRFLPRTVVLFRPMDEVPAIERVAPFLAGLRPAGLTATAYVCADFACRAPVTDPETMLEALGVAPRVP